MAKPKLPPEVVIVDDEQTSLLIMEEMLADAKYDVKPKFISWITKDRIIPCRALALQKSAHHPLGDHAFFPEPFHGKG